MQCIQRGLFGKTGVAGTEYAPINRQQMRCKTDRYIASRQGAKRLFDFWCMTMSGEAVGLKSFINLTIERINFGCTTSATGSRFTINDNGCWIDQALLKQWR